MKFIILYQGRSKKNIFAEAEKLYSKRIRRYQKIELEQINPLKLSNSLSIDQIREKEEAYFSKFIKPGSYCILLDEKGKSFNSKSF